MKLSRMFILISFLFTWSSVFSNGEIEQYQQERMKIMAEKLEIAKIWRGVKGPLENYKNHAKDILCPSCLGAKGCYKCVFTENDELGETRGLLCKTCTGRGLLETREKGRKLKGIANDIFSWDKWGQYSIGVKDWDKLIMILSTANVECNANGEIIVSCDDDVILEVDGGKGRMAVLEEYLNELKQQKSFAEELEKAIDREWVDGYCNGLLMGQKNLQRNEMCSEFTLEYAGVCETFCMNDMRDKIIERIARHDCKKIMNLSSCHSIYIDAAIRILEKGGAPAVLILNNCDLDNHTAQRFFTALANNESLHTIKLRGNDKLSKRVRMRFRNLIQRNKMRQTISERIAGGQVDGVIDFSGCKLSRCMDDVIKVIKDSCRDGWKVLMLTGCDLDDHAAQQFFAALANSESLHTIKLRGNDKLSKRVRMRFRNLVQRNRMRQTISERIAKGRADGVIDFSGCRLNRYINDVIGIIEDSCSGEVLMLTDCNLSDVAAQRLLAVLSQDARLHTIYLGGNRNLSAVKILELQSLLQRNCGQQRYIYSRSSLIGLDCYSAGEIAKMTVVVNAILSQVVNKINTASAVLTEEEWKSHVKQIIQGHNMPMIAQLYHHLAEGIHQVGQDKWIFNLSGCQSQECIEALIDVLNSRNDIGVVNVANCNLSLETARRLLAAVQHNTQLQIINVSGNNLPEDVMQAFQVIVEQNRAVVQQSLTGQPRELVSGISLFALAVDPALDNDTIRLLAQHPNSDPMLLSYIVTERSQIDRTILADVANNSNTTLDLLWAIIRHPGVDSAILAIVASHANVDAELVAEVSGMLAQSSFDYTLDGFGLDWQGLFTNTTVFDNEAGIGESWCLRSAINMFFDRCNLL